MKPYNILTTYNYIAQFHVNDRSDWYNFMISNLIGDRQIHWSQPKISIACHQTLASRVRGRDQFRIWSGYQLPIKFSYFNVVYIQYTRIYCYVHINRVHYILTVTPVACVLILPTVVQAGNHLVSMCIMYTHNNLIPWIIVCVHVLHSIITCR